MRFLLAVFSLALAAAASPPRGVFPFASQVHDYPNGLRLITIPTEVPNVVSVFVVVQAGSRNEVEPGRSGFAHLFEHIMFKGTPLTSPERYDAILREAGAASNAFTNDDLTAYHATFSKEDLPALLALEADRFQHLEYSQATFKTETLAVLGEYNKNSASPFAKISEKLRETAYDRHTYRHTTMGFLADIQNMPNLYDYSRQFFDRYYRPEYTTIIVAGDVDSAATARTVEKHWGAWKRGGYRAAIPVEPPQTGPREAHIDWPSPTLPWVVVAHKGPAFSETAKDGPALALLAAIGFGETSELYRRLVLREQKVETFNASAAEKVDPCLFTTGARVKSAADLDSVREDILATLEGFKENPVSARQLDTARRRLRYGFAQSFDNAEAVAGIVARYVALTRTPETINRLYAVYDSLTPEDLREAARKYFVASGRTTLTLTGRSK